MSLSGISGCFLLLVCCPELCCHSRRILQQRLLAKTLAARGDGGGGLLEHSGPPEFNLNIDIGGGDIRTIVVHRGDSVTKLAQVGCGVYCFSLCYCEKCARC